MMVVKHHIEGYESFVKFISNLKNDEPTFILYTGTKLPNGDSWCPDCVKAKPFIEKAFESTPKDTHLVVVEVGDRSFWKDHKCPFRTDSKSQVKVLPTLVRWGTQKRLEGNQLLDNGLIEMLLMDDED